MICYKVEHSVQKLIQRTEKMYCPFNCFVLLNFFIYVTQSNGNIW